MNERKLHDPTDPWVTEIVSIGCDTSVANEWLSRNGYKVVQILFECGGWFALVRYQVDKQ